MGSGRGLPHVTSALRQCPVYPVALTSVRPFSLRENDLADAIAFAIPTAGIAVVSSVSSVFKSFPTRMTSDAPAFSSDDRERN